MYTFLTAVDVICVLGTIVSITGAVRELLKKKDVASEDGETSVTIATADGKQIRAKMSKQELSRLVAQSKAL
jgi:hypothetical protein